MKPPMIGPIKGPINPNARQPENVSQSVFQPQETTTELEEDFNLLAKIGKAISRFNGSHRSLIDPPTVDKGDSPKKPAKKRHTNCAPIE